MRMTLFTTVLWALSPLLMWTMSCESRLVVMKMKNLMADLDNVQQQASELSAEYEELEGVCTIWANGRVKGTPKPKSCVDVQNIQSESGVATIYPADDTPLAVYCDQDTDGGGWTVFQRRQDGSVDFYKKWTEYQDGFGDLNGEFWLGLDALHMLTSRQKYELRVDLMMWNGTKGYATYSNFSISSSSDNYRLNFDSFTGGNAGDSLTHHRGQQFSTKDRDHDKRSMNCALHHHGAWWYTNCYMSSLNGQYMNSSTDPLAIGIEWLRFAGSGYSFQFSEMKFRAV